MTQIQFTPKDVERFWSKVDRSGGPDACWEWQGRRTDFGHGLFDYAGGEKNTGAHRVVWIITNGDVPDGLGVLHSCDNPHCCNPVHLFLGTQADNNRDMWNKGRGNATGPIGERAPQSILTEQLVMEIRQRYVDTDMPLGRMAREYGITRKGLILAINGTNWKHLPPVVPTVPPEEAERIRRIRAFNQRRIRSKLTEDQVRTIRATFAAGGITMAELARQYGLSHTAMDRIVRRLAWKHIV